jgi:hypothetical protein
VRPAPTTMLLDLRRQRIKLCEKCTFTTNFYCTGTSDNSQSMVVIHTYGNSYFFVDLCRRPKQQQPEGLLWTSGNAHARPARVLCPPHPDTASSISAAYGVRSPASILRFLGHHRDGWRADACAPAVARCVQRGEAPSCRRCLWLPRTPPCGRSPVARTTSLRLVVDESFDAREGCLARSRARVGIVPVAPIPPQPVRAAGGASLLPRARAQGHSSVVGLLGEPTSPWQRKAPAAASQGAA